MKKEKDDTIMTSRYRFFNLITPLLLIFISSCTLLSVGNVVKDGFGKQMAKGNPKGAAKYSTSGFGGVLRKFNPTQLKAIIALGAKDSGKGGKPPKASYHSFTSTGNKAVMVVKQGKAKVRFYCHKVKGEWKINDMVIVEDNKPLSFRDVLGIFASVFDIYDGLKIGKAPKENFGVNLGGAMKNIAPLLTHFLKNAGPLFPKKKKVAKKVKKEKPPFDVVIKTNKKGGTITVKLEGVVVLITLSRIADLWKFEQVKIDIKTRPPLYVAKLVNIGVPWLKFYLELGSLKGQGPKLTNKLLMLLDPSLREKLKPFIMKSTELLWPKVFAALNAPKKPSDNKKKAKFDLSAVLKMVDWEIKKESLVVKYNKAPVSAIIEISNNGQIKDLKVKHGELAINPTDFSAFSPWLSFAEAAKGNLKSSTGRAKLVKGFVSLLSKNSRDGIEGHLPNEVSIPIDMILATVLPKTTKKNSDKVAKKPAPLVDMKKIVVKKSSDEKLLNIDFPLMGDNASIIFEKESGVWRLHRVNWRGKELLDYLKLVPMLLRFTQGVVKTDSKMLASAFGDILGGNLEHGLKETFKMHGSKMQKLGGEVFLLLMEKISKKKKIDNPKKASAPKKIVLPSFVKDSKGNYLFSMGKIKLNFNKKKDGTIGFGYGPCSEKGKKTKRRRRRRRRKICYKGYHKGDPIQLAELLPFAISYFYGVADFNYKSLRKFSAYKFYKDVWKVLTRKKLRSLLKAQKVDLKVPSAKEIVDLIIPPADKKESSKKKKKLKIALRGKGFIVSRDRRYPFIEIWLTNDGKKIDISFSWDKSKKMWVLYNIEVEVKFFGKMGVGKLLKAL